MIRSVLVAGAAGALLVLTGCSSRVKEQNAVLRAEVADLSQRATQAEQSYARAQSDADAATAQVQATESKLAAAQSEARNNSAAALNGQQDLRRLEGELATSRAQLEAAQRQLAVASRPEPTPTAPRATQSPELAAFRTDLQAALARYHVTGVDVDLRTARDGQQRVALVLQNSFRAGSASLSYNMGATKAVVGLGKLISESYSGSRVVVEGHTDSDPINKTRNKWDSNDALSLARAEEVKKILRQSGVADRMVSSVGMGDRQPVSTGRTDRAKAANRRVEIYIYPASS